MTVSFFLKRSKDKKKGIRDAWTYGASIVVIYVTLGLAITLVFGASALNALYECSIHPFLPDAGGVCGFLLRSVRDNVALRGVRL